MNLPIFHSHVSFYSVALSSLNQLTLSDKSATIMVQNTLQPPNDNPIQDFSLFPGPSAAMVDMAKPQNFTAAGRLEWGFISHYM